MLRLRRYLPFLRPTLPAKPPQSFLSKFWFDLVRAVVQPTGLPGKSACSSAPSTAHSVTSAPPQIVDQFLVPDSGRGEESSVFGGKAAAFIGAMQLLTDDV